MSEKVVEKDLLLQAEGFWQKFQKPILGVLGIAVIGIGGWFAYKKFVVEPKEAKAADAIYSVQVNFAKDSSKLVINGDGGANKGALYVIKNYSGTKAANLAHFYAGVSYLKLNDFTNAIKYLKDFSTDALQIQGAAYTALGHAYAGNNQKDEAVNYYKKAAAALPEDKETSAFNLDLAAQLLETMNKNEDALKLYKEIKEKYPNTSKGFTVDKNIYRLSIEKNDLSIK